MRCISNSRYNSHTEPLFGKLKLLKLSDIFDLTTATVMYKYRNGKLPRSFDNMFEELGLGNRTMSYRIDRIKNKSLDSFPKVVLPRNWNSLPLDVKSCPSLKSFQKNIKKRAFQKYEMYHCNKTNCYSCKSKS